MWSEGKVGEEELEEGEGGEKKEEKEGEGKRGP